MKSDISCALCGSSDVSVVAETDRDGNSLRNVICDTCGLVWVDPRPTESEINEFYSEKYRSDYKGDFEPKMKHCWRETHRAIGRLEGLAPYYTSGAKILDIGAGAGFFAYVLRKNGAQVDGIEPNKGYAGFAQNKLGIDSITMGYLGDVEKEGYYDIITINHVFEHLPNPLESLLQMKQLLNAEGRIILEVPNIKATYHSPNKVFHVGHLYWYSPETIRAMAAKAGFKVVDLVLTEGTEHVSVVLQKSMDEIDVEAVTRIYQGQSEAIQSLLGSRSMMAHYMTKTPYVRFFNKMKMYLNEQRQIKGFDDKIELINSISVPKVLSD